MTRDDIIRMARKAGLLVPSFRIDGGLALGACTVPDFERFASIVAAAEREACAEIADEYDYQLVAGSCARDIRSRSGPCQDQ